jgi:hypothetical protein
MGVIAVGKKLKPGRWEPAAVAAEHLETTPDEVRRRLLRHELDGFQVRPRGRWYVTSEKPKDE